MAAEVDTIVSNRFTAARKWLAPGSSFLQNEEAPSSETEADVKILPARKAAVTGAELAKLEQMTRDAVSVEFAKARSFSRAFLQALPVDGQKIRNSM